MDGTEKVPEIKKPGLPPSTTRGWLALGLAVLALLFCAWPRSEAPLRYPDSFLYLHWPTASYGPDQPVIPSRRPAGYPFPHGDFKGRGAGRARYPTSPGVGRGSLPCGRGELAPAPLPNLTAQERDSLLPRAHTRTRRSWRTR